MKDRREGEGWRESYFCESYRQFFDYAMPRFMEVGANIKAGARVETQPFL